MARPLLTVMPGPFTSESAPRAPAAARGPVVPSARLSLPMQLLRAREAMMQRFRPALRAHELTEQQWRVLRVLSEAAVTDMQGLARSCCIHPPSLSRIIPRLSARGLVVRLLGEVDHRRISVRLTPAGEAMLAVVGAEVWTAYAALLDEIGEHCVEQATVALAALVEALGAESILPADEEG